MTHPEMGGGEWHSARSALHFSVSAHSHVSICGFLDGSCFVFTFAVMYDGVSLTQVGRHVLVSSEVDDVILVDRLWQVTPLTHSEQQLPGCQLVPPLVHPRSIG